MCGRYSITSPTEAIQKLFQVPERPNLPPRYNVAPTQEVPAVRLGEDGARHLVLLRWGLIPFWAKDATIGNRLINARAESAATKPAFRAAFKARRCLVVADGFYEWKKPQKKGAAKQPYRATLKGGGPFGFAGLWERWNDPETQSTVESCTILTTDANPLLADIHERMPVIVDPTDFDPWLDTSVAAERAEALLKPFPAGKMAVYPVSTRVNSVANDGPDLVEPLDSGGATGQAELF
ncbi:SOS response-associated peptidase [Ferruginivarius sediminum]|uniref:Abasic site processing protein n=1 Tax=Ferruginivarius sediminum TaxID=2661937 RepID=A0A369T5V4_9PROT|nr:SOS response-associated peptidase [Ferruginivarius sediminum]RDD60700.1 SOS response-associated peptidase [Ferruginivarius sediminum]